MRGRAGDPAPARPRGDPIRGLVASAAAALLLLLLPAAALGHATLQDTSPPRGAQLDAAPDRVELRFSESVQAPENSVRVFSGDGTEVQAGQATDDGERVSIALPPDLPDGGYTATFRIVSADSHPISGGFSFSIGEGGAGPPSPRPRAGRRRSSEGDAIARVDFSGGEIPPGHFVEFPMSVAVPGKAGDTLAFKALQTYSDGEVVRWIGAPDSDKPASTITISEPGGLIEDSTGDHGGGGHEEPAEETVDTAPVAAVAPAEDGGDGLAIAALIVGGLGLAAGGAALVSARRSA